ncbi:unnamed protein product [Chironomus riparius]|uniref:Secreted protein n=1 Tax=Chironomus riparius TaxID=315576 RepID=A0A9N9S8J3_9DIPT|nr:unnamed protein product [Chironomus riparius]
MKLFEAIFGVFVVVAFAMSSPVPEDDEPAHQFTLLICQNWMVIGNGIHGDLNTELTNALNHFIDFIYSYQDLYTSQPKAEFYAAVDSEYKQANATFHSAKNIAIIKIAKKFNINVDQAADLLAKPEDFQMPFSCIRHILTKMSCAFNDTLEQAKFALELLGETHS